jgi:hypothetical protein
MLGTVVAVVAIVLTVGIGLGKLSGAMFEQAAGLKPKQKSASTRSNESYVAPEAGSTYPPRS